MKKDIQKNQQIISDKGLRVYADNTIYIDLSLWTTQALLTEKLNVSRNTVNNRVRRYEQNGTLRTYYIEQLGIKLIPNVDNINKLGKSKK